MSSGTSEAWRDSYDRWKLATPPEYSEDEREHPDDCGCEECDPECDYRQSLAEAAERGDFEHGELGEAGA